MISTALPTEWKLQPIGALHVGDIPKLNPIHFPDEHFKHFSIPAYQNGETPQLAKGADVLSQKLAIPRRCVLFGKLNPRVQKVWNVKSCSLYRHIASTEWLPIVPSEDTDQDFIYFLMWSDWVMPVAQRLVSGSTPSRQRVEPKAFYEIVVPVPELTEQREIAGVLNLVQEASRFQSTHVQSLQTLKRSVMRTLFTRGLRGDVQKETEIGPVPQTWETRTILELCEIWSGGTPRKSVPEYWAGKIPWISGKDLKSPSLDDAIDHVSTEGVESGSRLAPTESVLLLVRGMGLAKDLPVAVINRPMAFNQDVKALVSRGDYPGRFLRSAIYVGKDRLLNKVVPSAHGTMTLNLNDVENFKVPCPPNASETNEIVTILDAIDRKIDLHRRKHGVLDDLFKALLHKLMTGEVQVEDLNLPRKRGVPIG